jgi:hypothetical protein
MRDREIVLIGIGDIGGVCTRGFLRLARALSHARVMGIELPLLRELHAETVRP